MAESYHPSRVDKPWGYELIWAHTDRYAGKILHINQGESLSYQYHRVKDESILLILLKPTIIIQGEEEQSAFNGTAISDRSGM